MIFIFFLLLLPSPSSSLPAGSLCALNSQCSSSICIENTCCQAKTPIECSYCSQEDGSCASCKTGYKLSRGECVPSHEAGSPCLTNKDCFSNNKCLSSRCCESPVDPQCASCDTLGNCVQCGPGYYLDPPVCQKRKLIGELCEVFNFQSCLSGVCKDRCCFSQVDPFCAQCGSQGECVRCVAGYELQQGGICKGVQVRDGQSCSQDKQCINRKCKNGVCCSTPRCQICNKYGTCEKCDTAFYVDPGTEMCTPNFLDRQFKCARTTKLAKRRYCKKPAKKGERCCWICDTPCEKGFDCMRNNATSGVCR